MGQVGTREGELRGAEEQLLAAAVTEPAWWQRGVIYQIYPRSFNDANGDGVGDLQGIHQRLSYLEWLGVDAIWISPFYPSPMADFGYDVTDHCDVHPIFGTLEDFDRLLQAAHARGIRVIVDFVPNHTSDLHPWFQGSRRSRDDPKRDWYIWRDPAADGGPPNNWRAVFGGSAWEWDPATEQYYYHAFLPEQPDLDWRNPEVRAAMLDVLRFWLDRGVDGFRVDAIHHLIQDEQLRDNPPHPDPDPARGPYYELIHRHTIDQPEVHDAIAEMRAVLEEYGDKVMVTEAYLPMERIVRYYGEEGRGAHLPFNFQLIELPWDAREIASAVEAYERVLPDGAWPNWVLGNHDRSRIASRVGPTQARVAAMMLLTLRGTPTLYYGDEIGMEDVPIPPEKEQDPWGINIPGLGFGRDPERTPMQWEPAPNAGFTTGTPWLPISEDFERVNVAVQREDPRSMLSLHRRLIELRRAEPALSVGDFEMVYLDGAVIVFRRTHGTGEVTVALNLSDGPAVIDLGPSDEPRRVLLSTHCDRAGDPISRPLMLRPDEGVIVGI